MMSNISVCCGEIESAVGFVYVILPVILNHTLNEDCEQSWYSEDWRLIADPSTPETLMDPVSSVSSDRLVTSRCVNVIHEILCDASGFRMETLFRVRNETAATPNSDVLNEVTPSLRISDQLWWLFALFIIIFIIIILICFMLRKRIFRYFPKAETIIFQRNDPENRDPESDDDSLKKLKSDESDSLQFNISVSTG